MVLDTCYSGAAIDIGLRSPTFDAMENSVRRAASEIAKDDDKGVAVLASSLSRQAAKERTSRLGAWCVVACSVGGLEQSTTLHAETAVAVVGIGNEPDAQP